jgi:glutathione synthase/RimK-type ligase-like ATP-grasp enzyme
MKLVLANNQSEQFTKFYRELQLRSQIPFDYAGYRSLLFWFDSSSKQHIEVFNIQSKTALTDYDGVYINSYLSSYEYAASMAICCDYLGISFVNQELHSPPSLSKLSMFAKLASAGVPIPKSFGGSKQSILASEQKIADKLTYPVILKRADADRGIDNFKIASWDELTSTLQPYIDRTIWILQEFLPNNGFYRVNYYNQKPAFSLYRTIEHMPGAVSKQSHFYKPRGGVNASMVETAELPLAILKVCQEAINAMNRQIGGVDCIYDPAAGNAYVLEVNYNPQLVTIESYKEIRQQAFLDNLINL